MRFLPKDRFARVVLVGSFALVLIFVGYPILDQIPLSLSSGLALKRTWVGLANYQRLANDKNVSQAILVTLKYGLMVVPSATILGLLLAGVINSIRNLPVRSFFTSLFFFPSLVPLSAIATFWKFMLGPTEYGVVNGILHLFGLRPVPWLEGIQTALPSLAFVGIWGTMGYVMILLLAGMQSIPAMFHEAAAIDGANAWQQFLHVTVPLLMPTLVFVVIVLTFWSLTMFDQVFIMTGGELSHDPPGGPVGSTTTMVYLIYQQGFQSFHQGYAAAIAVVWFVVITIVAYAQFRIMSSRQFEY